MFNVYLHFESPTKRSIVKSGANFHSFFTRLSRFSIGFCNVPCSMSICITPSLWISLFFLLSGRSANNSPFHTAWFQNPLRYLLKLVVGWSFSSLKLKMTGKVLMWNSYTVYHNKFSKVSQVCVIPFLHISRHFFFAHCYVRGTSVFAVIYHDCRRLPACHRLQSMLNFRGVVCSRPLLWRLLKEMITWGISYNSLSKRLIVVLVSQSFVKLFRCKRGSESSSCCARLNFEKNFFKFYWFSFLYF